jgi:hypothetical protein
MTIVRRASIVIVVLIAAGALSCKGKTTGAKEYFAKEYSCPENQVTIASSTTKWGDLILAHSTEEPPDEVKNNRERLAKWRKDRDDEKREMRERLNDLDTFDVSGCGHTAVVACWRPGNGEGSPDLSRVACLHREK